MSIDPQWLSGLVGAIFGAILSAIAAPLISERLQKRRILREQKADLLRDLMATRFDSYNDQRGAEALNYIPVLFAGCADVLNAYGNYHDLESAATEARVIRFNELVVIIANHIGIDLRTADLMRRPIMSLQRKLDDEKTKINALAPVELKEMIRMQQENIKKLEKELAKKE